MLTGKENGFSLIELIVSLGITSFALLVASSLLYIGGSYTLSLREEFAAIGSAYRLEYKLRKVLPLAVQVTAVGGGGVQGTINIVDCQTFGTCAPGTWHNVGFFNRENSTGFETTAERSLLNTWLWYKMPVHDPAGRTSSSGLFVVAEGAGRGVASEDDFFVGQISSFQSEPVPINNNISKVIFRVSFRYHGVTDVRTWCPNDNVGGANCSFAGGKSPNFNDFQHEFSVTLVNNRLFDNVGDGSRTQGRVLGPFHLFKPLLPVEVL